MIDIANDKIVTRGKNMTFGYCRISTAKQNLERQERNILAAYPQARIVREVFTGTKFQGRQELDTLLRQLKSGDTLVFDSVSRMSRNANEGCELYQSLFARGIHLVFLKEPHINTQVYKDAIQKQISVQMNTGNDAADKFLNAIMKALNEYALDLAKQQIRLTFEQSEKEVSDLHQRTKEGIETARRNGKRIGAVLGRKNQIKKAAPAKAFIRKRNKAFGGDLSNEETWKLAGISKMTFYKYKRELLLDFSVAKM